MEKISHMANRIEAKEAVSKVNSGIFADGKF